MLLNSFSSYSSGGINYALGIDAVDLEFVKNTVNTSKTVTSTNKSFITDPKNIPLTSRYKITGSGFIHNFSSPTICNFTEDPGETDLSVLQALKILVDGEVVLYTAGRCELTIQSSQKTESSNMGALGFNDVSGENSTYVLYSEITYDYDINCDKIVVLTNKQSPIHGNQRSVYFNFGYLLYFRESIEFLTGFAWEKCTQSSKIKNLSQTCNIKYSLI